MSGRRRRVRRSRNVPASPPSDRVYAPSGYEMTPLALQDPMNSGTYLYGENIYDESPRPSPGFAYQTNYQTNDSALNSPLPSQVASTVDAYEPTSLAQELEGLVTPSPYDAEENEFENNNNNNGGGYSNTYGSEDSSSCLTSVGPAHSYDIPPRGHDETSRHQNTEGAAYGQQEPSISNQDSEGLSPQATTGAPFSFDRQREERLETHTVTGSAPGHNRRDHSDEDSGHIQKYTGTGPHHHQSSSPRNDGHQRTNTTPDTTPPKPAAEAVTQAATGPALTTGPNRPPTPIFIIPDEVGATGREAEFTPFYGEGNSAQQQNTSDHQTPEDRMAQDQIRRCAAIRGRPLTTDEIEVIESYYHAMGQRRLAAETQTQTAGEGEGADPDGDDSAEGDETGRMPNEVSQPSLVYTQEAWDKMHVDEQLLAHTQQGRNPAQVSFGFGGARNTDANGNGQGRRRVLSHSVHSHSLPSSNGEVEFTDPVTGEQQGKKKNRDGGDFFAKPEGNIAKRVTDLEGWVTEKQVQYADDKQLLDETVADVKSLRQTVEQWLARLAGRNTGDNSEDDIDGDHLGLPPNTQPGPAGARPHPAADNPLWWPFRPSDLHSTIVLFALAVFVWLITEAMLHSKRLSDGYGPMINGGYNGLGSVVVFGTWKKFFLFYAVALYLGQLPLLAIQRAMRR